MDCMRIQFAVKLGNCAGHVAECVAEMDGLGAMSLVRWIEKMYGAEWFLGLQLWELCRVCAWDISRLAIFWDAVLSSFDVPFPVVPGGIAVRAYVVPQSNRSRPVAC